MSDDATRNDTVEVERYRPELPAETSPKSLTRRYIAALGLVAVMILAGQALVQYILYSQRYDSQTINLAGRQRMLSRSISEAAMAIKLAPTPEDRLEPIRRLRQDLARWKKVHQGLLKGSEELGIPEKASPQVALLLDSAEPARIAIVDAAQLVLKDMEDGEPDCTQAKDLIHLLEKVNQFTIAMDQVVVAFQEEAEDRLEMAQVLQLLLAAAVLALLALEALFIFRPLVRRIRTGVRRLADEAAASAEAALTDGLTGIPNRRYFDQRLDELWRAAQNSGGNLSLIIADIDLFKAYNDSLGHEAGDQVLRQVAAALAGCVHRSGDRVARYGGEEFAAILPQSDLAGATNLAQAMREAVENLVIEHPDSEVSPRLTISLGVACLRPARGASPKELVMAADHALYAAKRAGRNQVARSREPRRP